MSETNQDIAVAFYKMAALDGRIEDADPGDVSQPQHHVLD